MRPLVRIAAALLFGYSVCLSEGLHPCHEYEKSLAEISKRSAGDRWDLFEILKLSIEDFRKMPKDDSGKVLKLLRSKQAKVQALLSDTLRPDLDSLASYCLRSYVDALRSDFSRIILNAEIGFGRKEWDALASCQENLKELRRQLDLHWSFLKTINEGDVLKWLRRARPEDIRKLLAELDRGAGGTVGRSGLDPLLREVAARADTNATYRKLLQATLRKELDRIKLEEILEAALHDDARFNEIVDVLTRKDITGDIVRGVLERSDDPTFISVMHGMVRERDLEMIERVLASKRVASSLLRDSAGMQEMTRKFTDRIRKSMLTLDSGAGAIGILPPLALQYTPELAARWRDTLEAALVSGLMGTGVRTVSLTRLRQLDLMREELEDSLRALAPAGSLNPGLISRLRTQVDPGRQLLALIQTDYWPAGEDSITLRLRWIDLGTGLVLGTWKATAASARDLPRLSRGWMESLRESANSQAAARIYVEGLAKKRIVTLDRQSSQILQFGKDPIAYTDLGGISGLKAADIDKIAFEPAIGGVSGVATYKEYQATLEQRLRAFRPDRLVFVTATKTGNDLIRLSVHADTNKPGNVLILGKVNTAKLFSISVECPTDSQWQSRESAHEWEARAYMANSAVLTLLSAYLDITVREAPFRWRVWYGLIPLGIPHLVNAFTARDKVDKSLYLVTGVALAAADAALGYYFWNEILVQEEGDYLRTRHELNMRSLEGLAWGSLVGAVRLASLATYIWLDEREDERPDRIETELRIDQDRVSLGAVYRF